MARSGNRMVAEVLARGLGMAQVFAPCYIALGKGSGVERHVEGHNRFGLHGNALLSRYPIRDIRLNDDFRLRRPNRRRGGFRQHRPRHVRAVRVP